MRRISTLACGLGDVPSASRFSSPRRTTSGWNQAFSTRLFLTGFLQRLVHLAQVLDPTRLVEDLLDEIVHRGPMRRSRQAERLLLLQPLPYKLRVELPEVG